LKFLGNSRPRFEAKIQGQDSRPRFKAKIQGKDRMSSMRPMRLTTKFTASALSLALGAAVLAWPAPARAEEDVPIDSKIFRSILEGIGLRKDGEAINYQERAPLVIPPGRALPPPEKSDAVIAKNPAWPIDPDVKRRKEEAARERSKITNADEELRNNERVLRPDELTPGRKPRTARQADPDGYQAPASGFGNAMAPSELGTKKSIFGSIFGKDEAEVGKFTGEPPRASLTAPPPGYQTPSPDQPYGVGKEKPKTTTSNDYVNDHPVGTQ
jgi:hypothetical protein